MDAQAGNGPVVPIAEEKIVIAAPREIDAEVLSRAKIERAAPLPGFVENFRPVADSGAEAIPVIRPERNLHLMAEFGFIGEGQRVTQGDHLLGCGQGLEREDEWQ